jgi:hypothetical protein
VQQGCHFLMTIPHSNGMCVLAIMISHIESSTRLDQKPAYPEMSPGSGQHQKGSTSAIQSVQVVSPPNTQANNFLYAIQHSHSEYLIGRNCHGHWPTIQEFSLHLHG